MTISNPFLGKMCVITGDLERYSRREALDLIRALGGTTSDNPVNSMNYLILGRAVWSEMNSGLAPRKVQKAIELRNKGKDLQIISEDDLYSLLDEYLPKMPQEVLAVTAHANMLAERLTLLNIPMVGDDTARVLADCFNNLAEVVSASVDELMNISGIGYEKAEQIYNFFRE